MAADRGDARNSETGLGGLLVLATGVALVLVSAGFAVFAYPGGKSNGEQGAFGAALSIVALVGIGIIFATIFEFPRPARRRESAPMTSNRGNGRWTAFMVVATAGLLAMMMGAFLWLEKIDRYAGAEIKIGLVVIIGVIAVMVLLFMMASGYSLMRIANPFEPLGLPSGSIRAMIALFLIVIFVIMGIYLFTKVQENSGSFGTFSGLTIQEVSQLDSVAFVAPEPAAPSPAPGETPAPQTFSGDINNPLSTEAKQLGTQLVTILGTLATAVSAFYFATQALTKQEDRLRLTGGPGLAGAPGSPSGGAPTGQVPAAAMADTAATSPVRTPETGRGAPAGGRRRPRAAAPEPEEAAAVEPEPEASYAQEPPEPPPLSPRPL